MIVATPAEAGEAAAEFLRDWRREPGVDVFEAALLGVMLRGGVESENGVPAVARILELRIEEQVGFGGEAEDGGAEDFCVIGVW